VRLLLLKHLHIGFLKENDEDLSSLADMVEARARIPGCQGLKTFETREGWLDRGSLATRVRLLRVLLPSLQELAFFIWDSAFHPCFIETQPQYLEALRVYALDDASVPSRGVLESAPMLKEIHILKYSKTLGGDASQPLIAVLRLGLGLLNLEKITFGGYNLNHVLFNVFIESFGTSACGERMLQLSLAKSASKECAFWQISSAGTPSLRRRL